MPYTIRTLRSVSLTNRLEGGRRAEMLNRAPLHRPFERTRTRIGSPLDVRIRPNTMRSIDGDDWSDGTYSILVGEALVDPSRALRRWGGYSRARRPTRSPARLHRPTASSQL